MKIRMRLWNLLYRAANIIEIPFYRRYLRSKVFSDELPSHVGIILDGNRRFARKHGLGWKDSYRLGARKVEEILDWLDDLGVRHVTLYAFSTENFSRPDDQVKAIFEVIDEELDRMFERLDRFKRSGVRFRALGRLDLLPFSIKDKIRRLEEATKDFGNKSVNLAIAYGGRTEIVDAVRKIAEKVRDGKLSSDEIDEKVIRDHLYAPDLPDPDLIIRTSGEERLSNFLLWESAYSELYFCEAYLPEFREIDLLRAIRDYQRRQRRMGS